MDIVDSGRGFRDDAQTFNNRGQREPPIEANELQRSAASLSGHRRACKLDRVPGTQRMPRDKLFGDRSKELRRFGNVPLSAQLPDAIQSAGELGVGCFARPVPADTGRHAFNGRSPRHDDIGVSVE
ncbi:MAG: hypothetical protein ACHP7B_02030 [Burkholderiales bacterium]